MMVTLALTVPPDSTKDVKGDPRKIILDKAKQEWPMAIGNLTFDDVTFS